ncbi:hypothetical protein BU14_0500s0015 [Porphyra umbilicalis]|uniref:Uncharacterized protein n=1 Tax=Porphyra umbilicalis TaxID=2786 RepID=A0A1X6NTJ0_PORUM|nr:hypothetical protein BU14_0500s0015 [Porphyra umbilicalis]|eukprot:OSX71816.1 hypothetical protein BU14_0500s0015 [Porphyra umbilicalis]
MHPPPPLGPITPAALAALPELALLRRSPAACRWLAPLSPLTPATAAAAAAVGELLRPLHPDALRNAVALDSEQRTVVGRGGGAGVDDPASRSSSSSTNGGCHSSSRCSSSSTSSSSWDVGATTDGMEGTLGPRTVLLSSLYVPLATDGGVVFGVAANEVLLNRVPEMGGAGLGDAFFLASTCRWAWDATTGELLVVNPRADGRAVMYSHSGGPAGAVWTVSVFERPPAGGAPPARRRSPAASRR